MRFISILFFVSWLPLHALACEHKPANQRRAGGEARLAEGHYCDAKKGSHNSCNRNIQKAMLTKDVRGKGHLDKVPRDPSRPNKYKYEARYSN